MVCDEERWVCVWQSSVRKMVCVKVVCERGRVTKLCVKDDVWQSGVWKMVCDKVVCEGWCGERWCVTKWCVKDGVVKDGVGESSVWKRACDKVVCERRCVTKWCVKDGVSKMVCDKVVCEKWCGERWCVEDGVVKDGVWQSGVWQSGVWNMVCQRWCLTKLGVKDGVLQRWCVKEGVSKMVCDKVVCERWCAKDVKDGGWQSWVWKMVCERWCVTKWCVKEGVSNCHAKRRWMWDCATPATWNQRRCDQVPRLLRETNVDVTKCHACHTKCRGVIHAKRPWMWDCATPATWNQCRCDQVPRLPHKVPRHHAQPKRAQAHHPVPWVPRLPRKTTVDVRLCHACHVKPRWMSPSATPATQSAAASRATKRAQARHPVPWVPRLLRKTTVDVRLRHACHVKPRWMSPSATPATKCRGVTRDQAGPSAPPSAMSATPATQNDRGCEIVPRLPRETKVDVTKRHACHAKFRGVCERWYATRWYLTDGVWQKDDKKMVCARWLLTDGVWQSCVWSYCMWKMVCDKMVFDRWYVTKLCVKFVCAWSYCMWKMVCDKTVFDRWYVTKLCVC